jgi:phosphatidylglycerol---prolipoprotein diacylglyceryl transferase
MTNSYLAFPKFDPVIFSIGPVSLHWYGLMYLVGFVFAMWLAVRRANKPGSGWTKDEVENLLYAGFLGRVRRWPRWLCVVLQPAAVPG